MKVTVSKIIESQPEAWQGLTKTDFFTQDTERVYLFSKPENAPKEGDELEGEIGLDKRGHKKFTRAKAFTGQPQEKVFKADPEKQESIEWQACLKAAVETVNNWHTQYGSDPVKLPDYKKQIVDCLVTYTQVIQKKPNQASDETPF